MHNKYQQSNVRVYTYRCCRARVMSLKRLFLKGECAHISTSVIFKFRLHQFYRNVQANDHVDCPIYIRMSDVLLLRAHTKALKYTAINIVAYTVGRSMAAAVSSPTSARGQDVASTSVSEWHHRKHRFHANGAAKYDELYTYTIELRLAERVTIFHYDRMQS